MKNHVASTRVLQLSVVLAVTGFCSMAHAQVENVPVQLALDNGQTMLNVTTRGNCSDDNHNGCVAVHRGRQARINFSLVGNKQCNRVGGGTWELGEVYLGGKNSPGKPGYWGGLDGEVQDDFNVADAASGRLNGESGSNNQSIVIFDSNNHEYDIWYKVTAVCVDGNGSIFDTVETDPRIKNEGLE